MYAEKSTDLSPFLQVDKASGLHYLPSQRIATNPQEILGSQWMSEIILRVRGEYDMVSSMRRRCLPWRMRCCCRAVADATLLVVRWGHTPAAWWRMR